ncbi:MAG: ribonuclease HII [Rickettsiales bacterium]|jgi:ribonuclease HII|nr:ribonuclease HII [Rickettsiales bacterium]
MTRPDFSFEIESGAKLVAGVDEAGRGPLCGPVVAAAVIIPLSSGIPCIPETIIIADSKKMTRRQRAIAYEWIMENCNVGVGQCSPTEIDELNILWASMLAMRRAIENLAVRPDFVLVDGNRLPDIIVPSVQKGAELYPGLAIVKGDAKSLSIAAASIIAKETRDKIMTGLAAQFPQYGWDKNAGYPTAFHLRAIEEHGINEHYRKSYGPVKRQKSEGERQK